MEEQLATKGERWESQGRMQQWGSVELGSRPVGVHVVPVWEPAEGAKLFRGTDVPHVPATDSHPEVRITPSKCLSCLR